MNYNDRANDKMVDELMFRLAGAENEMAGEGKNFHDIYEVIEQIYYLGDECKMTRRYVRKSDIEVRAISIRRGGRK